MQTVLLVIHLIIAIALVVTVLLQRSEGGALGIGGGGGMMTARGAGSLLTRATAILAGIFFLTSLALTIIATNSERGGSIMDQRYPEKAAPAVPDGTSPNQLPAPAKQPAAPEVPISE